MVRVLGQTTFEKGMEIGRIRGQQTLLRRQLELAFGPLSKPARDCLETMSSEDDLLELALKIREAKSLAELGLEE